MGNTASNFHDHKKLDLFKIYFCGPEECGTSIILKILDGYHHHQVSTIVYIIEFISGDKVLEILTISVKYIPNDYVMIININKKLIENDEGNHFLVESTNINLTDTAIIEIKEATKNKYIISVHKKEDGYGSFSNHKILEILEFKEAIPKDHVKIRPIIKCDIKIRKDDKITNDMKFKLSGPILNNYPMEIKYYSSRYMHYKNKKYFIKNLPLVEIQNNIINSWTIYPKIQIQFKEYFDKQFFIYYFDFHYEVH